MKICLFGDAKSVHIQRLACGLAMRGHKVHVVCHKPVDLPGVSVERFRVPPPGLTNPRRWRRRWAHYLEGFLRRFDVVNLHFLDEWGFTPDIMQSGCFVASAWGSDVVRPPDDEGPPSPELVASRISMLRHADAVTTCGQTFAVTTAEFAGIDVDRIDVVPFGVDLELFQPPLATPTRGAGSHRVGFFKGFREVYGAAFLIEAIPIVLNRLPETHFDLVGDGSQLSQCHELAVKLGVESSVEWIPRQPHHNIPTLLAGWDLTVIPSIHEAFGVAALESSAMGVPVVASDVGGLRDTVCNGETGLLVPPGSPEALADAIVTLLIDPARRLHMKQTGREWVQEHYEQQRTLDQWIEMFHQVLDRVSAVV